MRLGCIFDQANVVLLRQCGQAVEVGRSPGDMHGDHGAGALGNGGFDGIWVDIVAARFDIDKDRYGAD